MKQRTHRHLSRSMLAFLIGLGAVGLFILGRELPAFRRYLRMERM